MKFHRFGLWNIYTSPFKVFMKHHTELNHMYWSFAPVRNDAQRKLRKSEIENGQGLPLEVFDVTAPFKRRVTGSGDEWKKDFRSFDNWVRLSALISLLSYFEIYTKSICQLALQSDPLAPVGLSKQIDGIKLLKHEPRHKFNIDLTPFVTNRWSKRISYYKTIFRLIPPKLHEHEGELEQMRLMRNKFAHNFGRAEGKNIVVLMQQASMVELSEKRLQKWMGVIEEVARDIEGHLSKKHIGEFEMLYCYHIWITNPDLAKTAWDMTPRDSKKNVGVDFNENMARIYSGRPPGREFVNEMITYYNSTGMSAL